MIRCARLVISVTAVSAAALGLAGTASAADFGDGGPGYAYGGRPYLSGGSQRYSDSGRHDDDEDQGDDDDDIRDRRDDYDGDEQKYDGDDDRDHRRHAYREDHGPRHHGRGDRQGRCVPGWRVKQQLQSDGWTGFRLANYGEGVAVIRAERRHSGRPFLLKLDGCTGRTISARPVYRRDWSGYNPTPHARYSFKD